ncbi:BBM_1a_G0051630.mRNA.1.CDS.1 [Saccharomyces cerevisiae]|nr:BBM_1a_G0051630.mRNA.1.CDS.1 [Saccharomyces cerevisiae]CAI7354753.1 BBM_1a_G0051630.mRNA.1.CDS.1 [Saccharomyces cerevisiae]
MNRRLLVRSISCFQPLSRITFGRPNTPFLRKYADTSTAANTNSTILRKQLLSLKPISASDSLFISCTVFNSKGNIISMSEKFPKWSFLTEHSLFPRDLRKIDNSSIDIIPTIMCKPNCIVINLLHIKALIERDKVYVFDTTNPSAAAKLSVLMYDLESKLSSTKNNSQFYEHRALESIFINVMSALETDFKLHSQICIQILNDLENEVNRLKLRHLLIKSKDLTLFYQKTLLIRDLLDELLENDDDLANMYLTVKKSPKDNFSDLEMLIETYYTQCDEYVQQSESLIQDIKSTEEIVNIILDANRNSLMLLELKVTIYTLGFTVASVLPAFYGMNLKNFIEESEWGFTSVVVFSIVSALYITKKNFNSLRSVTKMTMYPNSPANSSVYPKTSASIALTNKLKRRRKWWKSTKQRLGVLLYGSSYINKANLSNNKINKGFSKVKKFNMENDIKNKQNRDMIWKWLIEDKKN